MIRLLAWRFLRSKSSDQFISLISWVSVAGVSLGVMALVVVMSVVNGFEGELIRVVTSLHGSVLLTSHGNPVGHPEEVEERILKLVPEAEAVTASFLMEGMVSSSEGVAGAVAEGIDLATVGRVNRVADRLVQGNLPQAGMQVVLGESLAKRLGAKLGSRVRWIAPFVGEALEGGDPGAPKIMDLEVVGIVSLGMYQYDSKYLFLPLKTMQDFLQQPGRVTTFKLKLKEQDLAKYAAGDLEQNVAERLGGYFAYPFKARPWSSLNRNLLYAIRLEKVVIAIILTAIVIVAAFNVVSTLMMMIHDKGREIAILKAMGLKPSSSFLVFTSIGTGIGLVGTVLGVSLGLGLLGLLASTRLIELPADIYNLGFLPVKVRWIEIFSIAAAALVISLLATLYPAASIARKTPIEGLRDDH